MKAPVFRSKRYRFFYPAGLISLVLLPLIGIGYLNYKKYFTAEHAIELNTWIPGVHKYDFETSKIYLPESILKEKYLKITLTGDENSNADKLTLAQNELRRIVKDNDTINGVFLQFDKNVKYKFFTEAINICLKEKAGYFTYYNNGIIIFNTHKLRLKPFVSFCGGDRSIIDLDSMLPKPYSSSLVSDSAITKRLRELWPVFLLYSGLILLSVKRLLIRLKTNH